MNSSPPINLPQEIRLLVAQYAADSISAEEINQGYCADFADALWRAHPDTIQVLGIYDAEDVIRLGIASETLLEAAIDGEIGHSFLLFENRFFDAECPEGVDSIIALPTFQRALLEYGEARLALNAPTCG